MKRFRFKGVGCAYGCEKQSGRVLFTFSFPCKKSEDIIISGNCPMDMSIKTFRIVGKRILKVSVNLVCYSSTDAAFEAILTLFTPRKVKL